MTRFALATLITVISIVLSSSASQAALLGDLAADYQDGTAGQTSDVVGISGAGGTWHYWSDTDADPLNGGLVLLTFSGVGLEGGDGFAGTGSLFSGCCGPMPALSNDGLFDGVTTPPAGTLASHPGGSTGTNVPPEYLVVEFRASAPLVDLTLDYGITNPSGGGDGVDWSILDDAGSTLFSATTNGSTDSASGVSIANILPGQSLWFVLGNGAGDDPGADQTFLSLAVNGTAAIPEPSTGVLLLFGLAGLASRRKNRTSRG